MKKFPVYTAFDARPHLSILKSLLIAAVVLVLGLDLLVHIIFYDLPFVAAEELLTALTMVGWASLFVIGLSFAGFLADAGIHYYRNRGLKPRAKELVNGRMFNLDSKRPARA